MRFWRLSRRCIPGSPAVYRPTSPPKPTAPLVDLCFAGSFGSFGPLGPLGSCGPAALAGSGAACATVLVAAGPSLLVIDADSRVVRAAIDLGQGPLTCVAACLVSCPLNA